MKKIKAEDLKNYNVNGENKEYILRYIKKLYWKLFNMRLKISEGTDVIDKYCLQNRCSIEGVNGIYDGIDISIKLINVLNQDNKFDVEDIDNFVKLYEFCLKMERGLLIISIETSIKYIISFLFLGVIIYLYMNSFYLIWL